MAKLSADIRVWVEAAISKHLKDKMPFADMPGYFVRCLLAQAMGYYGSKLPDKWRQVYASADDLSLARSMTECWLSSRTSVGTPIDLTACQPIMNVLESQDWESVVALPSDVWQMLRDISGISKEEWEMLPTVAEEAIKQPVQCPRCWTTKELADFGTVIKTFDPLVFGSATEIHLRCSRCGETAVVNSCNLNVGAHDSGTVTRSMIHCWLWISGAFIAVVLVLKALL